MAIDDSFMSGYYSSKMGAKTNIQVALQGNLTSGIVDSTLIMYNRMVNQNNLEESIATIVYPQPTNAQITLQKHYICDAIIRFTIDDAPDPFVLNFQTNGEIGGIMPRASRGLESVQNYFKCDLLSYEPRGLSSRPKKNSKCDPLPPSIVTSLQNIFQSHNTGAPIRFYLQHIFEKPYPPIPYNAIPHNQLETDKISN
ncbi:MAG: hypothetical protein EZS28_013753 [Streblomastix strix]|uniref:Uncharacterized protein n=1 Tax=Streblomastix strix TaxID=222440 RepID=A0A5J4W709_9EUKA|nr:MAG: hypothetical protein EZS28_013753 [Streblomastix strix]